MAVAMFFTRVSVKNVSEPSANYYEGTFVLDIERLNIYNKEFEFSHEGTDFDEANVVIYKRGRVFVEKKKASLNAKKRRLTKEQNLILTAFMVIFSHYQNKLDTKRFAVNVFDDTSLNISTPDNFGADFIRACM